MEKRYQVFVSSTFRDLVDERRAVMQALLELDCIPAGMEMFPASDDDQWTLIKSVITDCDYYVVIVGGRYGSLDSDGISFTEKEYDFAVESGKPILGFVHRDPGAIPVSKSDRDPKLVKRLERFRAKVQKKMCRFSTTPADLGAALTTSMVKLMKSHPAEGWVRAKYVKTTEDLDAVNQMHVKIRVLEEELAALRRSSAAVAPNLAQGDDIVQLDFAHGESAQSTWNDVFATVAKLCLAGAWEMQVSESISQMLRTPDGALLTSDELHPDCFAAIRLQLYCLGFVRFDTDPSKPYGSYGAISKYVSWSLTEAGKAALGQLLGAKRPE